MYQSQMCKQSLSKQTNMLHTLINIAWKKMNVEVGVKLQLIVGYKLTTKIFLTVTTWCPNEKIISSPEELKSVISVI